MAKKKKTDSDNPEKTERLKPETKKSVLAVICLGTAMFFMLAAFGKAGPAGNGTYRLTAALFGWGYYLLPAISLMMAMSFIASTRRRIIGVTLLGALLFVASGLGVIDLVSPGKGGLAGNLIGALEVPFGYPASFVIVITALIASSLITLNTHIRLPALFGSRRKNKEEKVIIRDKMAEVNADEAETDSAETAEDEKDDSEKEKEGKPDAERKNIAENKKPPSFMSLPIKDYTPPPLSLLKSASEKPTIGDLRANANIVKRTLESFGVPVEMGEVSIGPTVTRYTLKPAEGIKLSRITALHQDLALALASHPIRIEAPIPGKSLVGIEVPNKSAALVRLGSLLAYPEFQKSEPLSIVIGRDVSGEPIFSDISIMPHLLVAGSTGSGKSVCIHSLLVSLLFKNSPATLRLALVDPKKVELSVYEGIPHLIAPVVTEGKKTIALFRWAIQEMEKRYDSLLESGSRDIKSYNAKQKTPEGLMPYILIVIDELADLMASYGREIEGSVVRLAQMARATGIHLIVSTQRPSVEVITGLIKANITSRIALQVASQIDSRTILDMAGAEKLLGNGDLLFISHEFSKPKRIQGAYLSEDEIRKVTEFIRRNNAADDADAVDLSAKPESGATDIFDGFENSGDEDELYGEAVETVRSAGKASASLLQRRLKVGYARAARLLDIMENRGIIGPGEGAKPREVFTQSYEQRGESQ